MFPFTFSENISPQSEIREREGDIDEKRRLEKERWAAEEKRRKIETERWRIEEEREQIEIQLKRIEIKFQNLLEKGGYIIERIKEIDQRLGIGGEVEKEQPIPEELSEENKTTKSGREKKEDISDLNFKF